MDAALEEKSRKRKQPQNELFRGSGEDTATRNPDNEESHPKWKKARLSTKLFVNNCEISHDKLRELLKSAALGKQHKSTEQELSNLGWCHLSHPKHLNSVVVIVLQGVSQLHFYKFYLQFKHLRKAFRHRFRLPAPSANFLADIIGEQPNGNKEEKILSTPSTMQVSSSSLAKPQAIIDLQNDPIIQKYGHEKVGLVRCLLTKEEMKKFDFPLQGLANCKNFVSTECVGPVSNSSPLFGLDCEMCLTPNGNELTRVSLVDAKGRCVMDELVKPDNKILNYLTRFSGITRKILKPVTTKLKDVQAKLKKLLPPDAVLVGHSLNADLQALQMIHPNVIDTSLLFVRDLGRRFKLKFLAKAVLGKEIQCPDRVGHDSTEDAMATLELAQYFIKHGPRKIAEMKLDIAVNSQQFLASPKQKNTSPLCPSGPHKEARPSTDATWQKNAGILECLDLAGRKLLFLSQKAGGSTFMSSRFCQSILCTSDEEVLEQAQAEVPLSSFSVIQFSQWPHPLPPSLTVEMHKKMKVKWAEMSTVYAGPFGENFCLKPLKKLFASFGPIHSLEIVLETVEPYLCIQYGVLEAAQLAIETLNGACVQGAQIKVQRPVQELTLDCDTIVSTLETDPENESTIYVNGMKENYTEEDMTQKFSLLPGLEAVFLPVDPQSKKHKKYCFLKFRSSECTQSSLKILQGPTGLSWKLVCRRALTPTHLHEWICHSCPDTVPLVSTEKSPLVNKVTDDPGIILLVRKATPDWATFATQLHPSATNQLPLTALSPRMAPPLSSYLCNCPHSLYLPLPVPLISSLSSLSHCHIPLAHLLFDSSL
ncbi:acyl-coenzyme A synthetase ACSM3, mitochondrial isoform X3 [Sarcophilus harrisii]|nr:acyl-coenzyme A synthetase ACSM3, mitochondrial isoform X3 [Sarcophilus harrisii]XP_031798178.1 acyl-coenzyme A synthetase ACSM3, mitochondrial isoform X3 [Sarcophilus harrisii]XP_031798181.1 acyl-coenzyme A synthetase ACSM3, mitochondrial isoform X3 [Sarcophilus harrisii]